MKNTNFYIIYLVIDQKTMRIFISSKKQKVANPLEKISIPKFDVNPVNFED